MFMGAFLLFLMASLKNYKQLSLLSMFSIGTIVIAILAIVIDGSYTFAVHEHYDHPLVYFDASHILSFLARMSITMEGTALVPGIYASTRDKKAYSKIIVGALSLDGALSILLSFVGYLAYREKVRDIVLMNLSYGIVANVV